MLAAPEAEVTIFEGSSERALGAVALQQVFDLRDQTEPQHLRATLMPGEYHVRLVYYETRAGTGTRLAIELAREDIIVFEGKPVIAELDPVTAPNADPEIDLDADDDGLTNLDEIVAGTDPELNPILWEVSAGVEGLGRTDVVAGSQSLVIINSDASGEQLSASTHGWTNGQLIWTDNQEDSYKSDGDVVLMRGKSSVPTWRVVSAQGDHLWSHAFTGFTAGEVLASPYLDALNSIVFFATNGS